MRELVVYTTPTCGPCKQLKPELARLQEIYKFKMRIVELSGSTSKTFAAMGIRSAPTVVCVEDTVNVGMFVGMRSPEALKEQLRTWGLVRE